MIGMLIAYDANGNVVATLDYAVQHDADGAVVGLIDFAAREEAGLPVTDIWTASEAVGSKVWPEWIGGRAHEFKVELDGLPGAKHIAALVHKTSGHRRVRTEVAIAAVKPDADGARDIRGIVGGPGSPLILDEDGQTIDKAPIRGKPPPPIGR